MADYYTLLTNAGIAYETACKAAGVPIKLSQISVGDGGGAVYNPAATDTALKREVWRGPLNALFQDEKNPSWLLAEVTIPPEVGGWYVREAGLWTDTGILYAIVKYPESFKPVLATSGSGKEFYIRSIFETSNASLVTLLIDDTVVKATRAWVAGYVADELAKLDSKQSVRAATTANIVLSGAQAIDGVAVVAGDRVLVKAQTLAKDNGIYVVANGAWTRSKDADASVKVTSGLSVSVEEGSALADTIWQLITDSSIVLGSTALVFQNVTQGFASINSPALLGTPTCPVPPQFEASNLMVNAEFVQRALGSMRGSIGLVVSKDLTVADVGKRIELAPGVSITLPRTSTVPDGAALLISTQAAATSQVAVVAGDVLSMCNIPVPTPRQLAANSDFYVIREGNVWRAHLGTETLRTSSLFGSQLTSGGYQKLPSGLIMQWGINSVSAVNGNVQAFPFPIRFPNNCLQIVGGRDAPGSFDTMHVGKSVGDPAGTYLMQNFSASAELGKYLAVGY
ncbi:phage tail protein [Pseudomonas chlororaphis]|uniref:Phage tail protein n=1 Tax=Pseudomonas chlororaphis TaxID=587753 RepID=A0AB34CA29_9PSED|nr:phage tail protein [Pseudomonas chlororaphis]KAA5843929.1 phage tail protein [Pseudomonas chlororaphis]